MKFNDALDFNPTSCITFFLNKEAWDTVDRHLILVCPSVTEVGMGISNAHSYPSEPETKVPLKLLKVTQCQRERWDCSQVYLYRALL